MDFNPNAQLDDNIQSAGGGSAGGGRGGGIAVGGIGGVILLILALVFGFNPGDILGSNSGQTTQDQGTSTNDGCKTGADVQNNRDCRWKAYITSIQNYWGSAMNGYTKVKTVTFTGSVNTGCGQATSEVGPFYCPEDKLVYIDTSFADQLLQQLGAQGGYAAEAYILAHEYGHHVQDLTGQMAKAQSSGNQTGPTSPGVRLELQADCYAGVWFKNAQQNANDVIQNIKQDDLNRVVDAAAAVGDDRIQSKTQGQVTPESWTHGSAKMRQYWVGVGYTSGNPKSCDTFSTNNLGQ